MRQLRSFVALAVLLSSSAVAFAHGGGPHLMGTIKSVDAKAIVVTDMKNQDVTAAIDDKTTIEKDGKRVGMSDLVVGERVVVHTKKTDAGLVAVTIKSGKIDTEHHEHEHGEHHDEKPAK